DVFPIEFLEIKGSHKLVFGEDIFKDLDVPLKDVRLLCEQQIKGKLLHLRQAYLNAGQNPAVIKNFLTGVLDDLVPVFPHLIVLKEQKPLKAEEEMLEQLAKIFALDGEPFGAVYRDKIKKGPIPRHEIEAHFENFLSQLESLSRHLDSL